MRELIAYRREAEQYLGQDDHLYRVDCVSEFAVYFIRNLFGRRCSKNNAHMLGSQMQGPVSGRVMKIWLLGSSDPSADINSVSQPSNSKILSENGEEHRPVRNTRCMTVARWRAYMESYVLSSPTELVDLNGHLKGKLQRTFLNRYVLHLFLSLFYFCALMLIIFSSCYTSLCATYFGTPIRIFAPNRLGLFCDSWG